MWSLLILFGLLNFPLTKSQCEKNIIKSNLNEFGNGKIENCLTAAELGNVLKNFNYTTSTIVVLNSEIGSLEDDYFMDVQFLVTLTLNMCGIKQITSNAFNGLNELKNLAVTNNKLTILVPEIFDKLLQLETLDLSGNQIHNLDKKIFAKNQKLQTITFDDNKITLLTLDLFRHNSKLQQINLNRNKIVGVEHGTFKNLTKLKRIGLERNICIDEIVTDLKLLTKSLKMCEKFFSYKEEILERSCSSMMKHQVLSVEPEKRVEESEISWISLIVTAALLSITVNIFLLIKRLKRRSEERASGTSTEQLELSGRATVNGH